MIINFTEDGRHLFVHVDPARPDAWRKAPYFQQLRELARVNNPRGGQVVVSIGERYLVIFPDREVDIDDLTADEKAAFIAAKNT